VDFAGSNGQDPLGDRQAGKSPNTFLTTAEKAKAANLELVVGVVRSASIHWPELKKMREIHLTRFETRKVIFGGGCAVQSEDGGRSQKKHRQLRTAVAEEQARLFTARSRGEDAARIEMLDRRWEKIKGLKPPGFPLGADVDGNTRQFFSVAVFGATGAIGQGHLPLVT